MPKQDILRLAFSTAEWERFSEAMFEATGLAPSVVNTDACLTLYGGTACVACSAFDEPPGTTVACLGESLASTEQNRVQCRSGLWCAVVPVDQAATISISIVMCGYAASQQERTHARDRLARRGLDATSAGRAARSIPVLSHRAALSHARVAVAAAEEAIARQVDAKADGAKLDELEKIVAAGEDLLRVSGTPQQVGALVLRHSTAMGEAHAGVVWVPRGGRSEVIASTGENMPVVGTRRDITDELSGRALSLGRTIVSPGGHGQGASCAIPLRGDKAAVAVMSLVMARGSGAFAHDSVRLLERFARYAARAIERAEMSTKLTRERDSLMHLTGMTVKLVAASSTDEVVGAAMTTLLEAFEPDFVGVSLTAWFQDNLYVSQTTDVTEDDRRLLLVHAMGRDIQKDPFSRMISHEHATTSSAPLMDDWAMLSVDLSVGDHIVGSAVLGSKRTTFSAQDHRLMDAICEHVASSVEGVGLVTRLKEDHNKTIAALSATLDAGERAPAGHSMRVMDYAMMIGVEIGLTAEELEMLRFAGLLHDVGKTGISEEILLKPSPLDEGEMQVMKQHSEIGASIVEQVGFLKSITPVIMHHHERWDGAGYPAGLKGEEIPRLARALSVADSFDAMTADRPYRTGMTIRQARHEMAAAVGIQFDPAMVAALFDALDKRAIAGSTGLYVGMTRSDEGPQLPA